MSRPTKTPISSPLRFIQYWWRRLLHNFPQKLLALLLATACWYVATEARRATTEQRYDVPLTVRDHTRTGEKRAVSGLNPEQIQVTLSGPRQRLATVTTSDITAYIDVTDTPEGNFSSVVHVDIPEGTHTFRVQPKAAQGQLDAQKVRPYPVTVSMRQSEQAAQSNQVAQANQNAGLQSLSPHYQSAPASVSISGPSRLVSSVAQVVTTPVALRPGEQAGVRVLALDDQGMPVEVSIKPAQVLVSRTDKATLPIRYLPLKLQGQPKNLKVTVLSVEPASVRVLGDPAVLGTLKNVPATVPYHLGEYMAHPSYQLPAGVYVLDNAAVRLKGEALP